MSRKLSAEARAKVGRASAERWKDPEYRARHLPALLAAQPLGTKAGIAKWRVRPPKGTPEYRVYTKVARELGIEAARALQFKSAGTEGAGRP
jgi:hypothetical protein